MSSLYSTNEFYGDDLTNVKGWEDFEQIQRLFIAQVETNKVFKDFIERSRRTLRPKCLEELTFLPIQAFKWQKVKSGSWQEEFTFLSSGTTQTDRSEHYIKSVSEYLGRCRSIFSELIGEVHDYHHLVFMPFYQKNSQSSLLYMMTDFIAHGRSASQFVMDVPSLDDLIQKNAGQPLMIWTVTFGLIDFLKESVLKRLPEQVTFVETGGMKGKGPEVKREDLHRDVLDRWPNVKVLSEFGMCELQSQAYYLGDRFTAPTGLLCAGADFDDPFSIKASHQRGQLCFVDMANRHSCAFIATQDYGQVFSPRQFRIEGRLQASDLRGCNLMYQE